MKIQKLACVALPAIFMMIAGPRISWARSMAHARVSTSRRSASRSSNTGGQVFYVATNGNDSWSGKLAEPNPSRTDGPFLTLQRAQKAVRVLKSRGGLNGPVTVYIRGGEYDVSKPLVFEPADSGAPQAPITYAAYPGETPVISGGREISGWKRVKDRKLLAQAGGELWMARVPEVKQGKWYFRELFINGRRRPRARTPNQGSYFYVDGKIKVGKRGTFKFHSGDIKPEWAAEGNVEVVALMRWAAVRMYIRKVDAATRTVTLSGNPTVYHPEIDARYWIENTMDALNAPGEWYLNRQSGILYYRPEPGEEMNNIRAIAPVLKQFVLFEAGRGDSPVHDIRLSGLKFSYADWSMSPTGYADIQAAYDIPAAVAGVGTRSIEIRKCVFSHLGGYAVSFGGTEEQTGTRLGSSDNRIIGNDMVDLGGGGVKIGDGIFQNTYELGPGGTKINAHIDPDSPVQASEDNLISDNHIHHIGLVYPGAVGVWVGQSSDNTIAHNEINDTYYTGISVGWTWGHGSSAARGNKIELNKIYDIGQGMLTDMGCIYTLGVQPGTVERNNICHDVSRSVSLLYPLGGWGIYLDEGSSDILIEDNIVYRTEDPCFMLHTAANDDIVRNNVFAYGKHDQIQLAVSDPHLRFTFEHNIVYWNSGEVFRAALPENEFHFDHNLYYRTDGQPIRFGQWTLAKWQARGQDLHSLIADPLFVDPAKGDFSFKPGSPAVKIGFKPIDVSGVGPR
ncbi:MAG: right-handed parallel beta-helix repeat-containing protein [Acidobacteriota bacterium]